MNPFERNAVQKYNIVQTAVSRVQKDGAVLGVARQYLPLAANSRPDTATPFDSDGNPDSRGEFWRAGMRVREAPIRG